MREQIKDVLSKFPLSSPQELIPMAVALQERFGYVPELALDELALRTGLPQAKLFGMISFYDKIGFEPSDNTSIAGLGCKVSAGHKDPRSAVAGPPELRDILLGKMDTRSLYTVLRSLRNEIIEGMTVSIATTSCACASGSEALVDAIKLWNEGRNSKLIIRETGCYGWCWKQPVMEVQLPGKSRLVFTDMKPEDVQDILDTVHSGNASSHHLLGQNSVPQAEDWENIRHLDRMGWMKAQKRVITALWGRIDPGSIAEFIAHGGYGSLVKSILSHTARHICDLAEQSGLRGRGGGGFPAAVKWRTAVEESADQKYLICNAQESDPGSRITTALIESNPHQVLEGLAIAAYAIGASKAFVVLRTDTPLAIHRMKTAIAQATETGLLGANILGSGFNLSVKVFAIPGAFVCGEETALISALEGRRGTPWHKPPYPASKGFQRCPTVVNNAETLASLPSIIEHGPRWFRKIGSPDFPGTKLVELSGNIAHPGLVEIETGTPIIEILRQAGGGFLSKNGARAVLLGGPLGHILAKNELSLPLDKESLRKAGASSGSGRITALDDNDCMVDTARKVMRFVTQESCGKCIPCREGSAILLRILDDLVQRPENEQGHETLERFRGVMQMEDLAQVMQKTSQCGLGRAAANILLDTLRKFREEYDEHLFERHCRAGACGGLRSYHILPERCTGCNLCSRRCPEGAIIGSPHSVHRINYDKCTGCGICAEVCKFSAIRMN